MNALANEKVGDYVNAHFVSAAQKVGTFRVVNGRKQGGNVASYFCTPDGEVIHAVAGPVKADAFLREARWAVAVHEFARLESGGDRGKYAAVVGKAHTDRLRRDYGVEAGGIFPCVTAAKLTPDSLAQHPAVRGKGNVARVSLALAYFPLPKLTDLYPVVWEKVLNEELSLAPVRVAGRN